MYCMYVCMCVCVCVCVCVYRRAEEEYEALVKREEERLLSRAPQSKVNHIHNII